MNWDPVHDARAAFGVCMQALCSPGSTIELPPLPQVGDCAELDGAAAILLALLDRGLSLGVVGDASADRVADIVAAETGAHRDDVVGADWVLTHGPPAEAIARARRGTRFAPEHGATIVVAATGEPRPMSISGPGLREPTRAYVALDALSVRAFATANAASSCGVDLLVVTSAGVTGLPRSIQLRAEAA